MVNISSFSHHATVYFAYSELLGDFVNILFLFLGVVTVIAMNIIDVLMLPFFSGGLNGMQ